MFVYVMYPSLPPIHFQFWWLGYPRASRTCILMVGCIFSCWWYLISLLDTFITLDFSCSSVLICVTVTGVSIWGLPTLLNICLSKHTHTIDFGTPYHILLLWNERWVNNTGLLYVHIYVVMLVFRLYFCTAFHLPSRLTKIKNPLWW